MLFSYLNNISRKYFFIALTNEEKLHPVIEVKPAPAPVDLPDQTTKCPCVEDGDIVRGPSSPEAEERIQVIQFENAVQNIIYVK